MKLDPNDYDRLAAQLDAEIAQRQVGADASAAAPEGAAGSPDEADWPPPTGLPPALPPVHAFDPAMLPPKLRNWVMDVAKRMQCPPDYVAVAVVVAVSTVVAGRVVIQPKEHDTWQVAPNLWGMCVGRPGVKKSPAMNEGLEGLRRLEQAGYDTWKTEHRDWQVDVKMAELLRAEHEKEARKTIAADAAGAREKLQEDADTADALQEPHPPAFIVHDSTMEKLGVLMAQNDHCLLAYRDELNGLLTSLDKPGQEGARAFYLQAYDGSGGYTFERIGRGSLRIRRVCLAVLGSIQPGLIESYVRTAVTGGSGDDGLLQRFGLAVWPDPPTAFQYVDQEPDATARAAFIELFEQHLAGLKAGEGGELVVWRFDESAQKAYQACAIEFEDELRDDELHPALLAHLAKYRKLLPALALVFELTEGKDGKLVGEAALQQALRWMPYLRSHAERLYAPARRPELAGAHALLAKIKGGRLLDREGKPLDSFKAREVAQKGWTGLGTPEQVRKAADELVAWGFLRSELPPPSAVGGRPGSAVYRIHPSLRGKEPA